MGKLLYCFIVRTQLCMFANKLCACCLPAKPIYMLRGDPNACTGSSNRCLFSGPYYCGPGEAVADRESSGMEQEEDELDDISEDLPLASLRKGEELLKGKDVEIENPFDPRQLDQCTTGCWTVTMRGYRRTNTFWMIIQMDF